MARYERDINILHEKLAQVIHDTWDGQKLYVILAADFHHCMDFRLGLTTLSQSKLLKLNRVQNEAMKVFLGTTKDTSI